MDIIAYLLKLLNLKKEIGIDNLGTFYKKKNPGRYDAQTHRFLPPSYSLCFTPEVKETKNLALEITKDRHVSLTTANYFILQFATEVAKGLSDKGSYELEEIGTLISKNGQIEFIPEHPDEFGFDFFALPSVNSEISLPVTSSTKSDDDLDFKEPETTVVQQPVVAEKNIEYQFYIETVTPELVAEELEKENEQTKELLHPGQPGQVYQDEPSLGLEPDAEQGINVSQEELLHPGQPGQVYQNEPSLGLEPDAEQGINVSQEEPLHSDQPGQVYQNEPSLGLEPDAKQGINVSQKEPLHPGQPGQVYQDESSLGLEPDAEQGINVSQEEPLHPGHPGQVYQDESSLGLEPDAEQGINVSQEEPLHPGQPGQVYQDELSLGLEPDAEQGINVSQEEPLHPGQPGQVYQDEPSLGLEPDAEQGINVSQEEPFLPGQPGQVYQDEPSLGLEPDAEQGINVSQEEPFLPGHPGQVYQDEPSLGLEPDAEQGINVSQEEPLHPGQPGQVYQDEPSLGAVETDTTEKYAVEDNRSVTTENYALNTSSSETDSTDETSANKRGVSWLTKLIIVLFCLMVLGLILYMINPSFYDSLFGNNSNKNKSILPMDSNEGLNNMQDSLNFADSIMMTAEKVGLDVKKAKDTMKLTIKTQEASATTYEIISVAYDSQKKVDQYIQRMKKRGIVAKPVSNMPGKMIKVSIATYNDREAARKDLFKLKKELKNSSLYIYVNKNKG